MKIKNIPSENRPRERLQAFGVSALSNAELLAILIRAGNWKENAVELANQILKNYNLEKLSISSLNEIRVVNGIGTVKACQIIAAFELGRRVSSFKLENKDIISNSNDMAKTYIYRLSFLKKENFICVYLDSKNKIIRDEIISIGSIDASLIEPKEIFKTGLRENASSIILVHNHPSRDPKPSEEDVRITKQIIEAGKMLNMRILDHIIIGCNNYFSMRDEGIAFQ